MARNIVMFALVAVCGMPAFVAAQTALPIAVDQRVRVWTAAQEAITGRVASITADGFEVSNEGARTGAGGQIHGAQDRSQPGRYVEGRRRHERRDVGRDHLQARPARCSTGLQHEQVGEDGSSVGHAAALGAWSGGLFGGLIGAGVGAARAGEQWEQVCALEP